MKRDLCDELYVLCHASVHIHLASYSVASRGNSEPVFLALPGQGPVGNVICAFNDMKHIFHRWSVCWVSEMGGKGI